MQFRLKIHCPLLCSSAHVASIRKWTFKTFDSAADKADVSLLIWSDYSDYLKKALWTFLPVGLLMYGASGNSLVARFSRGMHQSKVKEHRNLGPETFVRQCQFESSAILTSLLSESRYPNAKNTKNHSYPYPALLPKIQVIEILVDLKSFSSGYFLVLYLKERGFPRVQNILLILSRTTYK